MKLGPLNFDYKSVSQQKIHPHASADLHLLSKPDARANELDLRE